MNPLSHFRGLKLRGNTIHVAQTGAAIKLDRSLARSAIAVLKLNSYIALMRLRRALSRKPSHGTIAFTPQIPGPWYNARLMSKFANLKITNDLASAQHIFMFDDSTYSTAADSLSYNYRAKAVNHKITDISKVNVGKIFETIFGYPLTIDPLIYHGEAVQKSDANGTHDGIIVNCPLTPTALKTGSAYQKLIDSTFNGSQSEDLRAAICFDEIALVFHKYKNIDKRFGTDYARVDICPPSQVFSQEECQKVIAFCKNIGLDFGAIDIMRDKEDGRIYIVDVNKTCMPVLSLSLKDQIKAFKVISASFLEQLS